MPGPIALVLAAGLGTRMKSARAKVLHEVAGRPLIVWAVENARRAGASRVVAILGHQLDEVRRTLDARYGAGTIGVAHQTQQRGTGHAVLSALPVIENEPDDRTVVILSGDAPLLLPKRVSELCEASQACAAKMALLSTRAERPVAYGHLVRDSAGALMKIVEHGDASPEERAIEEINAGFYAISLGHLRRDIAALTANNAQGELYLTDLAASAHRRGGAAVIHAPFAEISGINNRMDLAAVDRIARQRINEELMAAGVTIHCSETVCIDADSALIGQDSEVGPLVSIRGTCKIGQNVRIGQGCVIDSAELGDGVELLPYTVVTSSIIRAGARCGPFAHIGSDTTVDGKSHVGNFVETRSTHILADARIGQLSYVGHANIGAGAILGAGTITCDFDGQAMTRTTVEGGAFVGSNSQLVAPVTIGRDAYVGAGTTVTRDVARGSLALSRTKQVNVEGWADRFREALGKRKRGEAAEK